MSKIFISHSSVNNAHALAVTKWLEENGWDDYFLDVEPSRGLALSGTLAGSPQACRQSL